MENFENENLNLRVEIATLRRENATLNATVDRLTTLVEALLAEQAHNRPLPPPPSSALLRKRRYPQGEENVPRPAVPVAPVINIAPAQQRPSNNNNQPGRVNSFDPIPITYTELYPILIQKNWVQPRRPLAVPKKIPRGYKPKASCVFHQGAPGHDIEECCALKVEVQKLMRAGILTFKGAVVNVDANQISNHQISSVHRKDGCSRTQQQQNRTYFEPIPMTYSQLYPALIQKGLVTPRGYDNPPLNPPPAWYDRRKHCAFHKGAAGHDLEGCVALKIKVRDLIKSGVLTFKDVGPNMKTNPMAYYAGVSTSMMNTDQ